MMGIGALHRTRCLVRTKLSVQSDYKKFLISHQYSCTLGQSKIICDQFALGSDLYLQHKDVAFLFILTILSGVKKLW